MTVRVAHDFVSAIPDGDDATVVRPSNWNADHVIEGLGTAAEADTGDFATAAQGTKADSALQPAAIGVSVQPYDADLSAWAGVNPSSYSTSAQIAAAYQPLDSDLTALAAAGNSGVLAATTASFTTADETKLDGIEAGADVTDATNVAAAGAFMKASDDSDDITEGAAKLFMTTSERSKLSGIESGADVSEVFLATRNRFAGYTPNYNLNGAMVEGGGTNLSVQHIFDMGDITLPSGADKQHCVMRFAGIARNSDAFETAGAKYISFAMDSYNADAYGVIGTVTLKDGNKAVKAIYGRAVIESTDADIGGDYGGVGLVGAVTVASGTLATSAWALQLTIDGAGDLPSISSQRFISLGSAETSKNAGYGIIAASNIEFETAFIRAFNAGAAPFLQWQEPNGGGAGVHIDKFVVAKSGQVQAQIGSVGAPTYSFVSDTDTGMYSPTAGDIAFSSNGTQRLLYNSTSNAWQVGTTFQPATDNNRALGGSAARWSNCFATQLRPGPSGSQPIWTSGSGSPESVLTAPVGSLYTRTDGGASTTLYVKETGSGNTGWVAK